MISTKRHNAIVAGLEAENARLMGLFNDQTQRCLKLADIAREALAKYEALAKGDVEIKRSAQAAGNAPKVVV